MNKLLFLKGYFKKNKFVIRIYNALQNKRVKEKFKLNQVYSIDRRLVLFLGFDYRYVGNSKYFFEYLKERKQAKLLFVTRDKNIPENMRVEPDSEEFFYYFSVAKVVIGETWIPSVFPKRSGQYWIQLWHGTPFKKMLFDTKVKVFSIQEKRRRKQKKTDISYWDYLLADSKIGCEKLASSFEFNKNQILSIGYPRVEWLKKNKNNHLLKSQIKNKLGIKNEKKVLLYVPTWRDYNYVKSESDLSYLLDLENLKQLLSDDYVIINKNHSLEKNALDSCNIISAPAEIDVQHLILISDVLISDYSSIIFDGLAIERPFYLYIKDFEKYSSYRGVYDDMYNALKNYATNNVEELARKIKSCNFDKDGFYDIKKEYASTHMKNPNAVLKEFLTKLLSDFQ